MYSLFIGMTAVLLQARYLKILFHCNICDMRKAVFDESAVVKK